MPERPSDGNDQRETDHDLSTVRIDCRLDEGGIDIHMQCDTTYTIDSRHLGFSRILQCNSRPISGIVRNTAGNCRADPNQASANHTGIYDESPQANHMIAGVLQL